MEQISKIKESELAELKFIKSQISNAVSHIEQMSLAESSLGKSNSAKLNKDKNTGEG